MLRRIVGGLALAALITTGASAQSNDPFTESFTFIGPTGTAPSPMFNGQAFNSYTGEFNTASTSLGSAFPIGSAFQVWCVDENDFVTDGATYTVWVTPMSATDFSHTYQGAGAPGNYLDAAALTTEMSGPNQSANNDNVEYAIWKDMGYDAPPHNISGYYFTDYNAGPADPTTCTTTNSVSCDQYYASLGVSGIHANQWLIITALNNTTGKTQEFIFDDTDRTLQITPEPATMGMLAMGLVGLAGAGVRRRKRR